MTTNEPTSNHLGIRSCRPHHHVRGCHLGLLPSRIRQRYGVAMKFLTRPRSDIPPATQHHDVDYRAAAIEWGKTAVHGRVFFHYIEWDDIPEDIRDNAEFFSARIVNAALERT